MLRGSHKISETFHLLVSRFASGMVKTGEEKEKIHDPEYFLTIIPSNQLALQLKICLSISKEACFTGSRMSGVNITDLAQAAPGSWG